MQFGVSGFGAICDLETLYAGTLRDKVPQSQHSLLPVIPNFLQLAQDRQRLDSVS